MYLNFNMQDISLLTQQFCEDASYIKGYRPRTIERYRLVIKQYQRFSGVTSITDVTAENVRGLFFYGRTERSWTANTFIVYHKTLTVFFRWCRQSGYMEIDPLQGIALPRLERRIPPKLAKQEALRLLEIVYNYPYKYKYLRYRNHAIFATFLYAGLRKGELLNLHLTDVDIANRSIFVRQGKGGKDRIIPINCVLAEILGRYEEERKRLKKTCPEYFASLNRNSAYTDSGLKRLVRRIREVSGIEFTPHKLRHTFATLMSEGGCDVVVIKELLGHSDIKTTMIYVTATAERLRNEIGKHPLNSQGTRRTLPY